MTGGTDLTILLALAAGVISFLSPCVLPLVPAYLGQLTAIAVAGRASDAAAPNRWLAVRHAFAYVAGFGAVFTLLGVTATYLASGLAAYIPTLRVIGGLILIVLGLNLAGILRIPALERTWRPLDAGAAGSLATTTGSIALGTPGRAPGTGASLGDRLGGRLIGTNGGLLASFGLGAIFAIGWSPCIGIILGGILTMAATTGTVAAGRGPADRLHAGPRAAVHRDRARLRPRAGAAPSARAPRPYGVPHRRPARGPDRRGDGLRLAVADAALLHLPHGHLSGPWPRSDPGSATSASATA